MNPPDLEELIRRGQEKHRTPQSTSLTPGQFVQAMLAVGLIAFSITMGAVAAVVSIKLDKATALLERSNAVMEQLPAAADRVEKLIERVDGSVQRNIKELKDAVPEVSKGWIDGVRRGLNKEAE